MCGIEKSLFEQMYAGEAPWDIPGPQPAFVEIAPAVTGSVLDCGCGTGELAMFWASRGHQTTGFDFLDVPLERARRKAAERKLNVEFRQHDATKLDTFGGSFDTSSDSGLFHCLGGEGRHAYLRGLHGLLKPGSRFYLMCFGDKEPGTEGPSRVSKSELEAAFSQGWTIESISDKQAAIMPQYADMFSPGGPKSYFVVVKRR